MPSELVRASERPLRYLESQPPVPRSRHGSPRELCLTPPAQCARQQAEVAQTVSPSRSLSYAERALCPA